MHILSLLFNIFSIYSPQVPEQLTNFGSKAEIVLFNVWKLSLHIIRFFGVCDNILLISTLSLIIAFLKLINFKLLQ